MLSPYFQALPPIYLTCYVSGNFLMPGTDCVLPCSSAFGVSQFSSGGGGGREVQVLIPDKCGPFKVCIRLHFLSQ